MNVLQILSYPNPIQVSDRRESWRDLGMRWRLLQQAARLGVGLGLGLGLGMRGEASLRGFGEETVGCHACPALPSAPSLRPSYPLGRMLRVSSLNTYFCYCHYYFDRPGRGRGLFPPRRHW